MKINPKYTFAFTLVLLTEIFIALFVRDTIIRPYGGDVLVVILMYTFIRSFTEKPIHYLPVYLFLFSVAIEVSQYYHLVELLKLQDNKLISVILGNSFSMGDILCYLIGAIILMIWEKALGRVSFKK